MEHNDNPYFVTKNTYLWDAVDDDDNIQHMPRLQRRKYSIPICHPFNIIQRQKYISDFEVHCQPRKVLEIRNILCFHLPENFISKKFDNVKLKYDLS